MGGLLLRSLRMCIFEEDLCRFIGLDCFAMLIAYLLS